MTSEEIAYLALLVSVVSAIMSFIALYRDRHVVRVLADALIDQAGICHLLVSVSNSGRRPISINHILIRPPNHPGVYINFSRDNQNRVDVGDSKGCQISPVNLPVTWSNIEELHTFKIYAADAVGKLHRATFNGKQNALSRIKRFLSWA
jgi:hypothetical protein